MVEKQQDDDEIRSDDLERVVLEVEIRNTIGSLKTCRNLLSLKKRNENENNHFSHLPGCNNFDGFEGIWKLGNV